MIALYPRAPLTKTDAIIARGSVTAASLISSDIWTAESAPSKVYTGVSNPTMKESPSDDHPPRLVNVPKTSEAEARGDSIQMGMMTAKKPTMWMIRIMPSTNSSRWARKELKLTQKAVVAMIKSVPCHRSEEYVVSLRVMRPWMTVPTMDVNNAKPIC